MAAAPLAVLGHLTILGDDAGAGRLSIEFRGGVVALELPDLRTALALRRKIPRAGRRAWLDRLRAALGHAGLEFLVEVGGLRVARLAADTRPGRLAAWLGLDPMEVELRPVLAILARRRRSGRPR